MTVRVRFAPSPTGHLHVGNVRTALFNWLFAKRQGGKFILRIEDTDVERSSKESELLIYDDLQWLGLDWDEGPDAGGDYGPYRQSQRQEVYRQYTERLLKEEKAYYCFCTPEELGAERKRAQKEGRPPKYNRKCYGIKKSEAERRIKAGEQASVRFYVQEGEEIVWHDVVKGRTAIPSDVVGDQIIMRPNGIPRYNWAVVVDDYLMKITHVIRGDDHVPNTPLQLLLYRALGWEEPKLAHLAMIVGTDHARLSKRHGATSINQFKEAGYLPEAMLNYLSLLGWSPGDEEKLSLKRLVEKFSLKKVSSSAAVFDLHKLNWLNGRYLHEMEPAKLAELLTPVLRKEGVLCDDIDDNQQKWMVQIAHCFRTSLVVLNDIVEETRLIFVFDVPEENDDSPEAKIMNSEGTKEFVELLLQAADEIPPSTPERYREMMMSLMKKTDRKGKSLFQPARIAMTGKISGPELEHFVPLVENGSSLDLPKPVLSIRERLRIFLDEFYN